jgi:mono/diheme cytochrome c family protein
MRIRTALLWLTLVGGVSAQVPTLIQAPRFWNDNELSDWATPLATPGLRPGHFSEREYYAAPDGELVRTYPVYFPGREPGGYWEEIREKKPEPLIEPGSRTTRDWIAAGQRVFEEMDVLAFRSTDPSLLAAARSIEEVKNRGGHPQKDGRILGLRWVPTSKGLALGVSDCAGCHSRVMPDGSILPGAPFNDPGDGLGGELIGRGVASFFPGETPAQVLFREFNVPWFANDIHGSLKTMTEAELSALAMSILPGTFARFNGSPFYMTKVPDLIGIKDRKYIDHTATHRLRGPADIMRYTALVSCCDSADFGSYRILTDAQRTMLYKFPDDVAFALAQYIYALEPPPNPNLRDARAAAGKLVFDREGCSQCHTPPLYTNNMLTLAAGFTPPQSHPLAADIMPVSVGTDPNLALKTRKGTGLYQVPSLKGVWYRGMFNHDGSVTRLEEWFDPRRLRDDFVPSGFKGYKVAMRAVPGHAYGLELSAQDKAALIAFLKSL